ncbi:condensation domain-containing protein [Williamsia sterculiae]|uniref:Condensation domain-containing protein n=1 Tax=Williamsia sterculiae TaxID=1344003 RepID=A0A1N7DTB7_9NOCA|nr:condensation domain-containing protein [Williamsia sterculiae]SIR79087.1 Condensation domain-containing protein [Williamsia sterculiae]
MRVTTIDRFDTASGEILSWAVDVSRSAPRVSAVPPSFNQTVHLASAGEHSVWLAAAFTVDGPIDRTALHRAYHALITRHGTLHSAFRRDGDVFVREEYDARTLTLRPNPGVRATSPQTTRQAIWKALDAACHPFGFPAYFLAAIDRPDASTIVCGFDHSHVDAYSISIIVNDLHRLYRGHRDALETFSAELLPMSGNFVDYCAEESAATPIRPSDPRLLSWLRFFDERDGTPPSFPLDLGVAPGQTAPQRTDVRPLLDEAATERFAALCRRNGASPLAGVLAAMADTVRRLGGGPELALLFPLHTRRNGPWENAVGWFTTNAPLQVVGGRDALDSVRRTGSALRSAMRLAEVPVPQVISAMNGMNMVRRDIFMVSYIDYRVLPGGDVHTELDAHHISNVTTADDAQFWISRTDHGLAIRTRYPDTAIGRATIDTFLGSVARSIEHTLSMSVQGLTTTVADPTARRHARSTAVPAAS